MSTPEITLATPAHRDRIVESLVAAFPDDPVLRHLFPDDATYPAYAAEFFGHLFDKRVHRNAIWTAGNGASVAIWEPPASADDAATSGGTPEMRLPAEVLARIREYDTRLHEALPQDPYWYLGVLGTHPRSRGHRWGHALMSVGLRRAAADGLPAVLETATTGNVEMYRRAGWQVHGTVDGPVPVWIMIRPAAGPVGDGVSG